MLHSFSEISQALVGMPCIVILLCIHLHNVALKVNSSTSNPSKSLGSNGRCCLNPGKREEVPKLPFIFSQIGKGENTPRKFREHSIRLQNLKDLLQYALTLLCSEVVSWFHINGLNLKGCIYKITAKFCNIGCGEISCYCIDISSLSFGICTVDLDYVHGHTLVISPKTQPYKGDTAAQQDRNGTRLIISASGRDLEALDPFVWEEVIALFKVDPRPSIDIACTNEHVRVAFKEVEVIKHLVRLLNCDKNILYEPMKGNGLNDFIVDLSRTIRANARLNVKGWWQFPSVGLFLFPTSILHVALEQQILIVGTRRGIVELYDLAESASLIHSVSLHDWGFQWMTVALLIALLGHLIILLL
ncbi:hypothetical protein VNO77_22507 [Canavalia gladiata]|uniref:Uncharacterized protein n=1 Tax=Canavalia gladiata TaxID=3824 RepID=A0AAN9L5B7_CANGL